MEENKSYTKVISAGIIIVRQTQQGPRFLLLYRAKGVWDFPRGRMEGDEKSWQTAFREVSEETGLKKSDLEMQQNFKVYEKFPYSRGKEKIFKIVIFYLAKTEKSEIKISSEHEGYGWFSYHEARRMLSRYKVRVAILKRAFFYIKGPTPVVASPAVAT